MLDDPPPAWRVWALACVERGWVLIQFGSLCPHSEITIGALHPEACGNVPNWQCFTEHHTQTDVPEGQGGQMGKAVVFMLGIIPDGPSALSVSPWGWF